MVLFKYLEDKDVFQTFYTTKLSKRLIHGVSASDESEASMISKLKEACGFEYTNKLQRMFTGLFITLNLIFLADFVQTWVLVKTSQTPLRSVCRKIIVIWTLRSASWSSEPTSGLSTHPHMTLSFHKRLYLHTTGSRSTTRANIQVVSSPGSGTIRRMNCARITSTRSTSWWQVRIRRLCCFSTTDLIPCHWTNWYLPLRSRRISWLRCWLCWSRRSCSSMRSRINMIWTPVSSSILFTRGLIASFLVRLQVEEDPC